MCLQIDFRLLRLKVPHTNHRFPFLAYQLVLNEKIQNSVVAKQEEKKPIDVYWVHLSAGGPANQPGFFIHLMTSWRSGDQAVFFFGGSRPGWACASHGGVRSGKKQAAICKVSKVLSQQCPATSELLCWPKKVLWWIPRSRSRHKFLLWKLSGRKEYF